MQLSHIKYRTKNKRVLNRCAFIKFITTRLYCKDKAVSKDINKNNEFKYLPLSLMVFLLTQSLKHENSFYYSKSKHLIAVLFQIFILLNLKIRCSIYAKAKYIVP